MHDANSGQLAGSLVWVGRVMSAMVILMLLFSGGIKVAGRPEVATTLTSLGWPVTAGVPIGILELTIALLYALPRTATLGAVLMTGLLGAAMATHIRVDSPLFSHVLFGLYMGLFAWGGLWLRDGRLRSMIPLRRS